MSVISILMDENGRSRSRQEIAEYAGSLERRLAGLEIGTRGIDERKELDKVRNFAQGEMGLLDAILNYCEQSWGLIADDQGGRALREFAARIKAARGPGILPAPARPRIVCLCGSTRFMDAFHAANRERSLLGQIVLTVEIRTYDKTTDPQGSDPEVKRALDELHLRKIDLADEVFVLNVGGYIGESTRKEIDYAMTAGKRIKFLEPATGSEP